MTEPRILIPPTYNDLLVAGSELVRAQFLGPLYKRLPGLTPISEQAGRLLYDRGGAPSISAGVVMFHEAITTDKPSLRKILRRADEAAGRRPRRKRSVAQKLVAMTVKAGGFTRTKTGQLKTMKPGFRRRLKVEQKRAARLKLAARKKREKSVLRRLGVRR